MIFNKLRPIVQRREVDFCRKLTSRITADMEGMRDSTETAALRIGDLLNEIVGTATTGNSEIQQSLHRFVSSESTGANSETGERTETISETIERQSRMISELVETIQDCFQRQQTLHRSATAASKRVYQTAKETQRLMARSRILSLNVRIEADRLGNEHGSAFATLANEMKSFSDDVGTANGVIVDAISDFVEEMPKLEAETAEIGESLSSFSKEFETEMDDVRRESQAITGVLQCALNQTELQNNKILELSHATLSELQFQDPVAQGLRRAEHDVNKLNLLFEQREVEDDSLADMVDDVGHDGRDEIESGEVTLF